MSSTLRSFIASRPRVMAVMSCAGTLPVGSIDSNCPVGVRILRNRIVASADPSTPCPRAFTAQGSAATSAAMRARSASGHHTASFRDRFRTLPRTSAKESAASQNRPYAAFVRNPMSSDTAPPTTDKNGVAVAAAAVIPAVHASPDLTANATAAAHAATAIAGAATRRATTLPLMVVSCWKYREGLWYSRHSASRRNLTAVVRSQRDSERRLSSRPGS
mmetsp:Transcript_8153/g.29794  ORF Transcript_8153/g.29794 Transcript_8153/m.29794 type:complete len:218 (-) Transcript_8153:385-1038(-)